ncbi:hypothetical protein CC86DRAFT_410799 [Ophiobolus disseminans]|uniref:Uncharacterized protein n=1 Tax=Ophiobolus disseminans TaxID=1469910 RepID=A0A6A6ZM25_9PLEO|nr:hypothetical protein CC86DRAFT_410799 [Ophiobolus disseminans]
MEPAESFEHDAIDATAMSDPEDQHAPPTAVAVLAASSRTPIVNDATHNAHDESGVDSESTSPATAVVLAASSSIPIANDATPHATDAIDDLGTGDEGIPSARAAVPAATSTIPAAPQAHPNALKVWMHNLSNALLAQALNLPATMANAILPEPVRQEWIHLFTALHTKYANLPIRYRYGIPIVAFSVLYTEYQNPGYFPRPASLTNGIIGFLCASAIILAVVTLHDYIETKKWPWQEDGWNTAYDFGASVSTAAPATLQRVGFATPEASITPAARIGTVMPPPTARKQPIIIPPTPFLPPGLRPIHLPPPTPHPSGLLGASPEPRRFSHFSGDGFVDKHNNLRAIAQWSKPQGGRFQHVREMMGVERMDGEERAGGEGGRLVDIEEVEEDVEEDGDEEDTEEEEVGESLISVDEI